MIKALFILAFGLWTGSGLIYATVCHQGGNTALTPAFECIKPAGRRALEVPTLYLHLAVLGPLWALKQTATNVQTTDAPSTHLDWLTTKENR